MEDDNLSGPSFAENQKERAGTGNYGKLWVQAYNALEADKKSATLMEGYKALLNAISSKKIKITGTRLSKI